MEHLRVATRAVEMCYSLIKRSLPTSTYIAYMTGNYSDLVVRSTSGFDHGATRQTQVLRTMWDAFHRR